MNTPAITIDRVSKAFPLTKGKRFLALENISFEILNGEFFVLVGPSGSGKSTLLRIMTGLDSATVGSVSFGPGLGRSDMSFVFQQFALLPWLTVSENVALGLVARGVSESARRERVGKELQRLGLEKSAHVYPRELSGGMRQRVGIARAFATDPKIIFMDEPFSELDSFTAQELRKEVLEIWQERTPTIVMVTHLIPEALELGDRIAVLTPRPGKIEKIIENTLPRPRNHRSEDFFRREDQLRALIKP